MKKIELYNDHFQNFKRYNIPRAQLVIADIPYNLGANAYASSTEWYVNGDNKQGESTKAGKQFFNTDSNFNIVEYMHFCSKLLKKEIEERLHDKEDPSEALDIGERHAKNLIAEAIQVAAMIEKYKQTNDLFNGVAK